MRKIFISFLFIVIFANGAMATDKIASTLSRIENSLFGIEYSNQTNSKRLERIEEAVYGEAKSGNIKTRLDKLSKDAATNLMGQEISPKRDTFEEEDYYSDNQKLAQKGSNNLSQAHQNKNFDNYFEEEKAEPNIDYPVVNDLEEQVFGKTYKHLDLNTRLTKLEQHSLRKTYDDALSDRVERLKSKLAYNPTKNNLQEESNYFADNTYGQFSNQWQNKYENDENYFSPQTVAQNNSEKYWDNEINDRDFRAKLNKLEKKVFKNSFSSDTTNNRLSGLEGTIFNTQFNNDSDNARLSRIASAVQAQKSAKKYDANSINQKIGSVLQIGLMVLMVVAMIL